MSAVIFSLRDSSNLTYTWYESSNSCRISNYTGVYTPPIESWISPTLSDCFDKIQGAGYDIGSLLFESSFDIFSSEDLMVALVKMFATVVVGVIFHGFFLSIIWLLKT